MVTRTSVWIRRFLPVLLLTVGLPSALSAQPSGSLAAVDSSLYQDLDFRMVGPTRGGRVTTVEGHSAHPHTFYMGGAGGSGVWKTTDEGKSWINLSDGAGFKSTSIGAIEVPRSDTSIVYVGTGTDGIRANVTTGRGFYKSTDAGKTWEFMGLENAGQIGAVEAHPENADRLYVAAMGHPFGKNKQRGVFRSTDGGETWEKVLYASDSTGAVDIELHPTKPNVIYATMWRAERKPWTIISGGDNGDGLYKSTDGGDTWTRLENGLPQGLVGKMDLAVTPAMPDRVYALVEAPGKKQGLYRSEDAGQSWTQTSDTTGIMTRPFYFTNITAHPKNPDKVYVGNVSYWVSSDGGHTFERRPVTHGDIHDLWINPEHPKIQVQGNDGGATVTLDGGKSWSTQHNQPTAELYQINVDERFPYWMYSGQQDNSTIGVPSRPPAESAPSGPDSWWKAVGGCETGPAVPQPNTPIFFSNCKGRFYRYSMETGQAQGYFVGAQYMYGRNPAKLKWRFQRVVPIEISPHDSSVVYHGSQYVHKTTNGGEEWERISPDLTAFKPQFQMRSGGPITNDITGEEHYSTLYAVRVSHHDQDVIWAGANDGPVHVTRDQGETWTDVTPPDVPPNGRVDAIAPSPHQPGTATVAIQRRLFKDFSPYIYRTTDYGQTWTRVTDGIPSDYPVRTVREDPNREGLLYAGTDFGLFVSFDAGRNWQPLQLDLPVTPITDIRIHRKDFAISTMGRSFWTLENLTPLYQMDEQVANAEQHLFDPQDAYRMRYYGGQRGPSGPEYPDPGAAFDFVLAEAPDAPITLDILDDEGTLVRRYAGVAEEMESEGEPMESGRMGEPQPPVPASSIDTFTVEAGHNRFRWELEHAGPEPAGGDGPLVVPGQYRVRLSAGDWSQTRTFKVKMDPRVRKAGTTVADLQEQFEYNMQLQRSIGEAEALASAVDSARSDVQEARESGAMGESEASALIERLDDLHGELVTSEEGSYQPPMLIDQFGYLTWMTTSADQKLGEDAFTRFDTLRSRLNELQDRWERLQQDVPV